MEQYTFKEKILWLLLYSMSSARSFPDAEIHGVLPQERSLEERLFTEPNFQHFILGKAD